MPTAFKVDECGWTSLTDAQYSFFLYSSRCQRSAWVMSFTGHSFGRI